MNLGGKVDDGPLILRALILTWWTETIHAVKIVVWFYITTIAAEWWCDLDWKNEWFLSANLSMIYRYLSEFLIIQVTMVRTLQWYKPTSNASAV